MRQTYLICILFFSCICSAEMPERLNYEELCESSDLVVKAKYISSLSQELEIKNFVYSEYTFEVSKYYKGNSRQNIISVLIPIKRAEDIADFYAPKYQRQETYFLFLQKHENDIYIKSEIDSIWGDRPFNQKDERLIENEIKEQNTSDRWLKKEDNLIYKIPDDANEQEIALSEHQKKRYLKIIEYYKNDEIVGKRCWHRNGVMAYEQPYKNGLRHGIEKEWLDSGSLFRLCCYRKDRYHGYLLKWGKTSDLEITFWVRGKNVSQEDYMKQCKNNITLPKFSTQ